MRIFKGSSITLELPVHICGAGNFSIEKVVIYTDNPNNAVEFRNHMLIDEVLYVYVNSNSLDILNDGVINYIVEGDGIYIEKMSSYFLKSPKDYTAISLEVEKREVTVTTNNSTTTITKNPQYVGMEEVKIHTEIPLEEDKSYEFTENNTSFDIVPDEGYYGIKSGKVSVNIPTQTISKTFEDNGTYEVVPDEGRLLDKVEVNVDIPLQYGKEIFVTTNGETIEIEPEDGYKGIAEGKVTVNIPTQDEKTVNIVMNGTTEVLPDEGYDLIRKVNINTDVQLISKPKIPNGYSFSSSTWETFDMGDYDFSNHYYFAYMFSNCKTLKRVENFPQDAKPYGATIRMFYNTIDLEEIPMMDLSCVGNTVAMFGGEGKNEKIEELPPYNMHSVMTADNMFQNFNNLKRVPQYDFSNMLSCNTMFYTHVENVELGGFLNIRCNLPLSELRVLSESSINNVLDGLYNFTENYITPNNTEGNIIFYSSVKNSLTEEQINKATSKGWVIK